MKRCMAVEAMGWAQGWFPAPTYSLAPPCQIAAIVAECNNQSALLKVFFRFKCVRERFSALGWRFEQKSK